MKLLLHTCCAPCSIYPIKKLKENNTTPTLFWYNPNIHPYKEYEARLTTLKSYANLIDMNLIIQDDYGLNEFCKNVINNIQTRCSDYCYLERLRKTFEYAKENNFDTVSTTLLVSIYQNHDKIKEIGFDLEKEFGINFLYIDFREGFREGQAEARNLGLYMQKYCGCVFSESDRYLKKK